MSTATAPARVNTEVPSPGLPVRPPRITSIDALRGFVMFTMIFVNDLAGAPHRLVPDWMVHFSDRHRGSGMTFVDLVFPAFLFIVGLSIPFALGSRLNKGEPLWKTVGHVLTRTLALLAIGILMVNGESAARSSGAWSPDLWAATMFLSAIFAFCTIQPKGVKDDRRRFWRAFTLIVRAAGFAGLIYCALTFQGRRDQSIITFSPLSIRTSWYGILGLIGWAYVAGSVVFLVFRGNRTALLGCVVLLMCFFPAEKKGFFEGFWPAHYVGFGETLGSQAAITVAGVLLASVLVASDKITTSSRVRFTLWFIAGFAAAAYLLNGLYGISKNNATPSWCLWSSAITAALWLGFYFVCDVRPVAFIARPLAGAGQNVLLAYLLSEMLGSVFDLLHLGGWYGSLAEPNLACAVARSAGCGVVLLCLTAGLNRAGFRLKL